MVPVWSTYVPLKKQLSFSSRWNIPICMSFFFTCGLGIWLLVIVRISHYSYSCTLMLKVSSRHAQLLLPVGNIVMRSFMTVTECADLHDVLISTLTTWWDGKWGQNPAYWIMHICFYLAWLSLQIFSYLLDNWFKWSLITFSGALLISAPKYLYYIFGCPLKIPGDEQGWRANSESCIAAVSESLILCNDNFVLRKQYSL